MRDESSDRVQSAREPDKNECNLKLDQNSNIEQTRLLKTVSWYEMENFDSVKTFLQFLFFRRKVFNEITSVNITIILY